MELNVPEELISGNHQKIAQWAKKSILSFNFNPKTGLKIRKLG